MSRERWPSRTMFIFAAIGSAVGLGNIWRFPYLVGKYGGGAFLFPYFIMLFLVGFPLLILEFSIGQKMQQGSVGAFKKIGKKYSGVGLAALFGGFGVSCYYAVVMGWALLYTFYSINLSWTADPKAFFYEDVLQISSGPDVLGGFSTPALVGMLASWVLVYFCVWKGIKSVSQVIKITMPLPVILLVVLLCRTIFLPGAMEGLAFYLTPNFSALLDFDVWMAAIAQVFFTLSLGFGVMIAYASYQNKDTDIVMSALIISLADVAIAFIAGMVIFTTIGYMAYVSDDTIANLASSGPSLAFIVFPHALSLIPGASFFAVVFFLTLISLGIDSLFSLVEAMATLIYDSFSHLNRKLIVFYVCLACASGGLIFTTAAGIFYLDISDHYITIYMLVLTGFLQAIVIGWFYDIGELRSYINQVSTIQISAFWEVAIKYLIPLALLGIIGRTLYRDLTNLYEGYPLWAQSFFGWGVVGVMLTICASVSLFHLKKEKLTRHRKKN